MESSTNINSTTSDSQFPSSMELIEDNTVYIKPTDKQILEGVERFRAFHFEKRLITEDIQSLALELVGNGKEELLNKALGDHFGISKSYSSYKEVI